jgi:hypothetical protein
MLQLVSKTDMFNLISAQNDTDEQVVKAPANKVFHNMNFCEKPAEC